MKLPEHAKYGIRSSAAIALAIMLASFSVPSRAADDLRTVLAEMNQKAESFRSAKADFEWTSYVKESDRKDRQTGKIYLRRSANDIYVTVRLAQPAPQQLVYQVAYRDGKLSSWDSKIDQLTDPSVSKNRTEIKALMSTGFGGRGDDLTKAFDVTMAGWETVDKVKTAKLELIPKDAELKAEFPKITLWIDPLRNVPLQQQWFLQTPGNYKLAHYTNISLNDDLQSVLAEMNAKAESFKSAKADFEWITYTKLVDEKDTQTGQIYFRRSGGDVDMALHVAAPAAKQVVPKDGVAAPAAKQVVYKDGKVSMYEPKIDQLTEHIVSKNKADTDALLSLGFGGRGDDLLKNFEVKMIGWETVDKVRTARLELVPKDAELKTKFSKLDMWVDPVRNVPLQQQWFFEPSGDYKLAHYRDIKVNSHVSDDDFRLKTTSKTKVVHLQ
jgi:outer membrane lipoprotein-sorting protein